MLQSCVAAMQALVLLAVLWATWACPMNILNSRVMHVCKAHNLQ